MKRKILKIAIYRPPLADSLSRFLESLTDRIDFFSSVYENFVIVGDFNAQPLDSAIPAGTATLRQRCHNVEIDVVTTLCYSRK